MVSCSFSGPGFRQQVSVRDVLLGAKLGDRLGLAVDCRLATRHQTLVQVQAFLEYGLLHRLTAFYALIPCLEVLKIVKVN